MVKCYYDGNESLISYVISNHTKEKIELKNYEIFVKDKDDKILSNIYINSNKTIEPENEISVENRVIGKDLSSAYKMELKINSDNNKK